jgi:hypothetical protein
VFCGSASGGIGGELSDSTTNNKNNNKTSNNGEQEMEINHVGVSHDSG